jgi:Ohr subfamily peroxiredoxin
MPRNRKVLYTARVHATGGRERGIARSSDGRLDIRLSPPGGPGTGTNPEQLVAAGWAASFEGAIAFVARRMKVTLPAAPAIDAEVDLCLTGNAFSLNIRLKVGLPGLDRRVAQALVDAAQDTCPYSKVVKGSIDVVTTLV